MKVKLKMTGRNTKKNKGGNRSTREGATDNLQDLNETEEIIHTAKACLLLEIRNVRKTQDNQIRQVNQANMKLDNLKVHVDTLKEQMGTHGDQLLITEKKLWEHQEIYKKTRMILMKTKT